jgi:type II secretory pathway pseudopilin PulG
MYGGSQGVPSAKLKTGAAMTSVVLGILGFFTVGGLILGSILGLILGVTALRKARKMPREYGGEGLAITGIVLNLGVLVFGGIVVLIAAISVPNLLAARRAANTASAMVTLRSIHAAQEVYASGVGKGNYARTLKELGTDADGLLDSTILNSQITPKSGYLLGEMKVTPANGDEPAHYSITASPVVKEGAARTGNDNLFVDETGIIRHSDDPVRPATADSPPIGYGSQRRSTGSRVE